MPSVKPSNLTLLNGLWNFSHSSKHHSTTLRSRISGGLNKQEGRRIHGGGSEYGGGWKFFANYAPIIIDTKNLHKHHCKQLIFRILPHVYLIYYLGNSVIALAFLQVSSKKLKS